VTSLAGYTAVNATLIMMSAYCQVASLCEPITKLCPQVKRGGM